MGKIFLGLTWLVAVSLAVSGCLDKETSHTLYLEPNGAVTWMILEKDVRSDLKSEQDRAREEGEYLAAVAVEQHRVALALSHLDPTYLHTAIVRAERPYAVLTEARLGGLDRLMELYMSKLGLQATSTLERQNGTVTWTLAVYDSPSGSEDETLSELTDVFDGGQIVLVAGHFTSAVGLELSGNKRAATFRVSDKPSSTEPVRFSLTWTEIEK